MTNDLAVNIAAATFLGNLRKQTAQAHQNLENLPVSASIVNPGITLSSYAHYLWLMQNVMTDTEKFLFPKLQNCVPDLEKRLKSGLLQADLNAIGFAGKANITAFPNAGVFSEAFALGVFYVVEGSALGGRFILKNIQQNLGLTPEHGASYFAGYGAKTGSYWKNFLEALQAFEQQHDGASEINAGAKWAFEAIYKHFSEHGHEH